jgi:hypothetical protein
MSSQARSTKTITTKRITTRNLIQRPAKTGAGSLLPNHAAGTVAASKNRAWAIAAFTVER